MSKINFDSSVFITGFETENSKTKYNMIDKGFADFSNNMFSNLQEFRNLIEDSPILKDFALSLGSEKPLFELESVHYSKSTGYHDNKDYIMLNYASDCKSSEEYELIAKLVLFKNLKTKELSYNIAYEYDIDKNSVTKEHPEYDVDKTYTHYDNKYFDLKNEIENLKKYLGCPDNYIVNNETLNSMLIILKPKLLNDYNQFWIDFVKKWNADVEWDKKIVD